MLFHNVWITHASSKPSYTRRSGTHGCAPSPFRRRRHLDKYCDIRNIHAKTRTRASYRRAGSIMAWLTSVAGDFAMFSSVIASLCSAHRDVKSMALRPVSEKRFSQSQWNRESRPACGRSFAHETRGDGESHEEWSESPYLRRFRTILATEDFF